MSKAFRTILSVFFAAVALGTLLMAVCLARVGQWGAAAVSAAIFVVMVYQIATDKLTPP
jgi:hypothetical protein